MPRRPNSQPQAKVIKRAFHWALGYLTKNDIDWVTSKADAHGFEVEEASILIDAGFDLSNSGLGIESEKVREIALHEIKKVLDGYGYVLEKSREHSG